MDLDELRTVQRTERQKDTLQHLRDSFYRDVADYIEGLKERRTQAAERADDPFGDPDVGRLTDEIETAEEVVESLYERRVGKVVKLATFAAADMGGDEGGLTDEERALYDDLVERIRENRENILATLAGERNGGGNAESSVDPDESPAPSTSTDDGANAPEAPPDVPDVVADEGDSDDVLAEAMGGGDDAPASETSPQAASSDPSESSRPAERSDPADEPEPSATETPVAAGGADAGGAAVSESSASESTSDRTTVRITRDVGEIFGVDERAYELEREDVVTLPADNAEPLLQKDAAERLD